MADPKKPKIFLSYSHANSDVADEIDADFKKIGIELTRDIRHLGYRKSIKDFMNTIGKHNFILMLISDEYLRSEYCMYEVTELLGTHEFQERILPIVFDNVYGIFKPMGRAVYFDYWKDEKEKVEEYHRIHLDQGSLDTLKRIINIRNSIDTFFSQLNDLNTHSLTDLKRQHWQPLINTINFEDELEHWNRIKDSDRIQELENYLSIYANGNFSSDAEEKISYLTDLIKEKELFEKIEIANNISELEKLIHAHPNSKCIPEAKKKLTKLREIENERFYWEEVKNLNQLSSYEEYVKTYPNGTYLLIAKGKISELTEKFNEKEREKRRIIEEQEHWSRIVNSDEISQFENYLSVYPNGKFRDEAKGKIAALKNFNEEKRRWVDVEKVNDISLLQAYIRKYPNSKYIPEANEKLKYLIELNSELQQIDSLIELNKTDEKPDHKRRLLITAGILIIIVGIGLIIIGTFKSKSQTGSNISKADSVKVTGKSDGLDKDIPGSKYELIDNFADNHNNWPLNPDSTTLISVFKGSLIIHSFGNYANNSVIKPGIDLDKDFTCSVVAKWAYGINDNGFGIVYASGETGHYNYQNNFEIASDGYYLLSYSKNGTDWQYLNGWTKSNYINRGATPNTLQVEKKNGVIYFYINRHVVKTYPAFAKYGTDFGAHVDGRQTVEFSDFRLVGIRK